MNSVLTKTTDMLYWDGGADRKKKRLRKNCKNVYHAEIFDQIGDALVKPVHM